jgi:hypothetical protein
VIGVGFGFSAEERWVSAEFNLKATHWAHKVKGVGSAYWRVIGSVEEMIEKAKQMKQSWLRGIGFARLLEGMASNKTR